MEDGREVETRVQGSAFLAQAFRVETAAEAADRLSSIGKRYHDATHHCSAWRLGPPDRFVERSDDDGEPSGTAGIPIQGAIQRADLFDVVVVVTRYFGGTKLGTGGLVRAYAEAARLGLEAAPRREVFREARLSFACGYEDVGAIEAVLSREGSRIRSVDRDFGNRADFTVTVLRSQIDPLRGILVEATAGRVVVAAPHEG